MKVINRPGEESKDDAETIGSLRGDDQELCTGCCILLIYICSKNILCVSKLIALLIFNLNIEQINFLNVLLYLWKSVHMWLRIVYPWFFFLIFAFVVFKLYEIITINLKKGKVCIYQNDVSD